MRHATDADHVIAVATIVSREASVRGAALIGATWGIGHTLTILAVGGTIIVMDLVIPPRVGLLMEFAVAVMLIVLGLVALTGMPARLRGRIAPPEVRAPLRYQPADGRMHVHGGTGLAAHAHAHVHAHGDYLHRHRHGHGPDGHGHAENATPQALLDRAFGGLALYQWLRPLVVGVVHGLAGSAAVALLVLTEIHDPLWGLAYLALFGIGTVAGMMVVTAVISLPFAFSARQLPNFNAALRVVCGVLSIAFGLYLIWQVGFVGGLFGPAPLWNPH
jgi:high-affinity nickel-transport protein